jgi:hypothetical protein
MEPHKPSSRNAAARVPKEDGFCSSFLSRLFWFVICFEIMTFKKSVLSERSEFIDFSYVTRPIRSARGRTFGDMQIYANVERA